MRAAAENLPITTTPLAIAGVLIGFDLDRHRVYRATS